MPPPDSVSPRPDSHDGSGPAAEAVSKGRPSGNVHDLLPLVYDRLREIARRFVDSPGQATLQPTALVHEVYVKLVRSEPDRDFDREHFLCLAARAMRQILADHARQRGTAKRGGDWHRISLAIGDGESDTAVAGVDLADALNRLEQLDERQAQIAELRAFGGMTVPEVAHVLDVSPRTVDAQWRIARAWLQAELRPGS